MTGSRKTHSRRSSSVLTPLWRILSSEKAKQSKGLHLSTSPLVKVSPKNRSQSEHTFDILPDEELLETINTPVKKPPKRTSFQECVTVLAPPIPKPTDEMKERLEEVAENKIELRSQPKQKKQATTSFVSDALEYLTENQGKN